LTRQIEPQGNDVRIDQLSLRSFGICTALGFAVAIAATATFATPPEAAQSWLTVQKGSLVVRVNTDLTLNVDQGKGIPAWETARSSPPTIWVRPEKADEKQPPLQIRLADASDRTASDYDDGTHHGHRIRLKAFPNADVEVELIIALNDRGELLAQIAQVGGRDAIQRVAGLYDWAVKPAADTYLVVPRGSGYLIRSDSPQPVTLAGFVGAAYSLPMFGIVRGNASCYQIIETWWDAHVSIQHTPGQNTVMSLDWEASLGKLAYPRRVSFKFAEKMDYVGMAKAYRQYLIDHKELTTLRQQAEKTPSLKDFLTGVEYRWTGWEPAEYAQVLDNLHHFKEAGLPVTFFFPKWPTHGYAPGRPPDAGWQGYLQRQPVPGGWPAAKQLADAVHQLGCTVKLMVVPYYYDGNAPGYDPAKASNVGFPALSSRYFEDALTLLLDHLKQNDFPCDALYFDGHSAYSGYSEHKDAKGPLSRRQSFEAQSACFRRTRSRGIVVGAELARFWSVGDCSFFFFTDWANDRLREGEPIPLFPLVFHDCYGAYFSGGGYYDEGKYDWYADRNPRLYELMYAAMPSHNWLPGGSRPIRAEDWGTDAMNRRLAWLRLWHAYYQKVCYSEMLTHQFLNPAHTLQRVEFAGGVSAEFDLAKGLFRVHGVPGFSGDWQRPETITR
jgi:hypothetical protein